MSRDVEIDPRVGDVVRVIPVATDEQSPAPVTVTAVDDKFVHWERCSAPYKTCRKYWSGERVGSHGLSRLRLELIEERKA